MDSFGEGTEIVRVYLAAALAEARAVEDLLAEVDVDFAIEVEDFASRTLFGSRVARRWAGFWVRAGDVDRAAGALERGGHVAGLVDRSG